MGRDFNAFINTLEAQNTIKVVKSLSQLGQYDYSNCTPLDLEQIVLSLNPNSPKAITTICYVLNLYAKYLGNKDMYNMVHDIDRNALWMIAKKNAPKKFISQDSFELVYHDIGVYEEYNSFYQQTLFRALYEGIYNDDLSVVKNLRASNIEGCSITLVDDDGNKHDILVSEKLANDLIKLSTIDVWERRNRYGICKIKITGLHEDSCFKVENRSGSSEYSYRYTYYRILRKIAKEYLGYNLLPLQIYISGIMQRIKLNLNTYKITIDEAFADKNRDRLVGSIIADELKRSNCDTEVRNFREIVKGHLNVFNT